METTMRFFRSAGAVLVSAGFLALNGCATPTPYQPVSAQGQQAGGFKETAIEQDRYRVSFRGNSLTSRETVDLYLLYRAAELTLSKGYDGFSLTSRSTDQSTRLIPEHNLAYPGWDTSWAFYRPYYARGWGSDPFLRSNFEYREIRSYESSAEIQLFKGSKPPSADAFDARQVQSNLAGRIVLPGK
jgi:hypothetical protein